MVGKRRTGASMVGIELMVYREVNGGVYSSWWVGRFMLDEELMVDWEVNGGG
jgi:hypothetical protein